MRVSFVIPTRNQAPFIRRCIDSCLDQGISDAEVLVVDGASTDATRDILASYGDRIRWTSAPDRGQSDAVNQGVGRATGDIIAWINSDDFYPRAGIIGEVLALFSSDTDLDIVFGDGWMVDVSGGPIRRYRGRPLRAARDLVVHPASPLLQPAAFFRRQLFLDVGGLDDTLHFALDYDFWIRMWMRARRTLYVAADFAHATYHAEAKSVRNMKLQIAETIAIKRRHAAAAGLTQRDWPRLSIGIAQLYTYWALTRLGLLRAT